MPGWHPDADDKSSTGNQREELFLEEGILYRNKKFHPFPVQFGASAGPDWILGGSIPEPASGEPPLTTLTRALALQVRRYNASLYRLRRLHYYKHSGNDPATDPMPERNPTDGLPDPLPPINSSAFDTLVGLAEANWSTVVSEIDMFLDQSHGGLTILAADMIEVNGYVVSMRVIADTPSNVEIRTKLRTLEVGGSSSHVSISSAFSSY
jgi:hypothetical protein